MHQIRFVDGDIFGGSCRCNGVSEKLSSAFPGWTLWLGSADRQRRRWTVVGRPADSRRRRLCRQRRRKKKAFDRGGPVWPPRSYAKYSRLGGCLGGKAPLAKSHGVWGSRPAKIENI